MAKFDFTLAVDGTLDYDKVDRLFEAGCGDASFVGDSGPIFATFHRESRSLLDAVLTAIHQIESIPGLRVQALDADELVTLTDIANRLDRSPESIRLLANGRRGPGGFPAPVLGLRDRTKLWQWSEVAEWLRERLDADIDVGTGAIGPTINAALALRRGEAKLSDEERLVLLELV